MAPAGSSADIGELDAVIGEHGVDAIENGLDKCLEEHGGCSRIGPFH